VARDISQNKRAQAELVKRTEELARSNRDLEQFAYVASHDLHEPLRAVAGSVELLQRRYAGKLDAKADEFITHAVEGAGRMQRLIDDLLAFSRVGSRGGEFQMIAAQAALEDANKNLRQSIQESGAVVTTDELPELVADPLQLTMLFQNLLGNAIKFRGDKPPCIHVSAHRQETQWVLSVQDHGIGIDPKYFDRIFNIFQRLHTRAEYPGTGVGLAICKRIMERHNGSIWVESTPGEQTTFHCAFPAEALPLQKSKAGQSPRYSSKKK
jgi:light-regulated signal transduction histidine kinase (bacteriophytochrome)